MEENMSNKISELLSSPELMRNIQSLLSGLNTSDNNSEVLPAKSKNDVDVVNIFQNIGFNNISDFIKKIFGENQNERIALLTALKPFLNSEKQETLDLLIQILKAVNIFLTANILTQ